VLVKSVAWANLRAEILLLCIKASNALSSAPATFGEICTVRTGNKPRTRDDRQTGGGGLIKHVPEIFTHRALAQQTATGPKCKLLKQKRKRAGLANV